MKAEVSGGSSPNRQFRERKFNDFDAKVAVKRPRNQHGTTGSSDDALSRVAAIDDGSSTQYATYSYVGAGLIVESVRPQVTSNVATGDLRLSYGSAASNYAGLDNFDRVIEQLWLDNASDEVDRFEYGYDEVGNRLWRENVVSGDLGTPVHLDESYSYDEVYRLLGVERGDLDVNRDITGASRNFTQDWTLDGLGNWETFDDDGTSVTRTVNEANEIATSSAGINPVYDAAGNMIEGPTPGNETVRQHYEYDAWNRLTGAYDDDGAGDLDPNSPNATFEYDGRNYRIRKTAGGVVEAFFYNESQQLLETQVSGSMTEEFVWDLRYIDAPIFRYDGTNTFYYTSDANMNVTALVDASNGLVVERYHYDPYGRVEFLSDVFASLGTQATQYGNDFLYTGRKLDAETGLMYYRARYYDPFLGRFVQRDPIGYAAGDSNLYRYVGNGPISFRDPTGLKVSIRNPDEAAKADQILQQNGITGHQIVRAGEVTSYVVTDGKLKLPPRDAPAADEYLRQEIFMEMINSDRFFSFETAEAWEDHVEARWYIVQAALNSKVSFGTDEVLDDRFFDDAGRFTGQSRYEAIREMSKEANQQNYTMGCARCTIFVAKTGMSRTLEKDQYDSLCGQKNPSALNHPKIQIGALLEQATKVKDSDWVPGDISTMVNLGHEKVAKELDNSRLRLLALEGRPSDDPKEHVAGLIELERKKGGQLLNTYLIERARLQAAIPELEAELQNFPPGTESENLIYVGSGKWWGHFPNQPRLLTLEEWEEIVAGFEGNNEGAALSDARLFPHTDPEEQARAGEEKE
ncbi:MAG: hypothetical protein DWQ42_14160 [Planctomycetota bacterium]|nr:MAG: hypothetical protein DWQ42_14160 [Planctomycetota bacterium]